ncbi:hypothetical protein [Streptococcus gallolyticus]|uniref:Uncharacterized protein n=1 Tax=Streptococcus gallolyticus TaxID=315405 RepID=A0A139R6D7_9STRE|nr:hypothetical protein [Streptococcus gallolyticus]KXU10311.1 hypothetical protein SGADD03_00232 [Streptococcus gallolyticus]
MNDTIYQVKIISDSISITDWFSILSVIISIGSAAFVIYKEFRLSSEEKLNLTVSIQDEQCNTLKERAYLYFTFSNNSSRSTNIDEIYLSDRDATTHFTNVNHTIEGGSCIYNSVPVESELNPNIHENTLALPLTIPPYKSLGGYIAFNLGHYDSKILVDRNSTYISLFLPDKSFEFEAITAANMSNYSYHITPKGIETKYRDRKYKH